MGHCVLMLHSSDTIKTVELTKNKKKTKIQIWHKITNTQKQKVTEILPILDRAYVRETNVIIIIPLIVLNFTFSGNFILALLQEHMDYILYP